MTKTYFSPMLQIVSIKNTDIVTTSTVNISGTEYDSEKGSILAPNRDWDAGY